MRAGVRIFKRFLTMLLVASVVASVVVYYYKFTSKNQRFESCENDFKNNVFFIETSSRGYLDSRQACSIESAARAHPNWQIIVLLTAPLNKTFQQQFNKTFEDITNVEFKQIDINEFVRDTPSWILFKDGRLKMSKYRVEHTSDVLRLTTLYKWSGVYLDLDIIIAKSLKGFSKNWAVREHKETIANGAMAFSEDETGRHFANTAIRELVDKFNGTLWNYNGPGVITRTSKKICSTTDVTKMSPWTCSGFNVYAPEYFYPIPWTQAKNYFKAKETIPESHAYHVWNKKSHKFKIEKNSPYDRLAKEFCPSVYESGTLS